MDAVSHERLVPLDVAADAVTPAYLPATAADLHPTYYYRISSTNVCSLEGATC